MQLVSDKYVSRDFASSMMKPLHFPKCLRKLPNTFTIQNLARQKLFLNNMASIWEYIGRRKNHWPEFSWSRSLLSREWEMAISSVLTKSTWIMLSRISHNHLLFVKFVKNKRTSITISQRNVSFDSCTMGFISIIVWLAEIIYLFILEMSCNTISLICLLIFWVVSGVFLCYLDTLLEIAGCTPLINLIGFLQ